jgi:hypothetical protein
MSSSQLAPDAFPPPSGAFTGAPRRPAAADILFRLPALYREDPGALLPLAQAIADTGAWLAEETSRRLGFPFELGLGAGRGRAETGTTRSLLSFLSRDGAPPAIWPGVIVRPVGAVNRTLGGAAGGRLPGLPSSEEEAEELEIVPSPGRSAVVVWPAGTPKERADPARIPAALLPAGLSLQVVILEGPEPAFHISGERFRGWVQQ